MLKGKRAVINGGTTGIGAATVKLFAQNHAIVVFTGRNSEAGRALEQEILSVVPGCDVRYIQADVSKEDDMKNLADYMKRELGGCEILFNNAGIHLAGRLLETSPQEFDRIMSIDCRGVYLACYNADDVYLYRKYCRCSTSVCNRTKKGSK